MMIRKAALFFIAAGLALAAAHMYTVTLFEKANFGNTELAPGAYKVEVADQKVIIHQGKTQAESAVKVEEGPNKFDTTTVRLTKKDGKMCVEEIHLGGTKTKLILMMGSATM
jgi:hypothetical protein